MSQQRTIEYVCGKLQETLLSKNAAYGNSAAKSCRLANVKASTAILVRMSDKINRLENLAANPDVDTFDESFEDTILDLAGYCVLYLVNNKNEGDE